VVETAFFNSTLAAPVTFGVAVIAFCFIQSAWLARGWLAVASTTVRVPGLSAHIIHELVLDIPYMFDLLARDSYV